jgi:hypothetical protein
MARLAHVRVLLACTLLGAGAIALALRGTDEPDASVDTPQLDPSQLDPTPRACAECHAEIVADWESSLHAASWTDPVFRAEYDPAPAASCRGCHDPTTAAPGEHAIDCATCHVRAGRILATGSSPEGRAAHPIEIDLGLAEADRCGKCHQFNYSEDGIHDPSEALQNTLEEWRVSEAGARGQTCVDCHMPRRSHRFPGMADPQLLSAAIELEFETKRSAGGIDVTLRARGRQLGHSFPTGDVFRRAVLTVRSEQAEDRVLMQRWLARTADADGEDSHVRTVDDTRVPPPGSGEFVHTLHLADPTARQLDWTLELHRLPLALARQRGLPDATTIVKVSSGVVTLTD